MDASTAAWVTVGSCAGIVAAMCVCIWMSTQYAVMEGGVNRNDTLRYRQSDELEPNIIMASVAVEAEGIRDEKGEDGGL